MIVRSGGQNVTVRSLEDPLVNLTGEQLVAHLGLDSTSYTGKTVTVNSALTGTVAVYRCIDLIAGSVGALPCHLYEKESEANRTQVPNESRWPGSLARMVHDAPNPEMSAQRTWELAFAHALAWGNFYANVVRGRDGRPKELWPLRPDLTEPVRDRDTGQKFYRTTLPSGQRVNLRTDEVFHMPALSMDGMRGISPIEKVAANAIAIEQSAAEYAGRFYQNSAIPGVVLKAQGDLSKKPDTVQFIREQWQDMYGGMKRSHRLAILDGGMDIETLGIPPEAAQFIETRKYQIEEIARLYGIPPHMVGEVDRSTSWGTGIESMASGFVVFTLTPWFKRFEQTANMHFGFPQVMPSQSFRMLSDDRLYVEFTVSGLLRGDSKTRWETYALGRQWGILSRADVRRLENLPVSEDGSDDGYLTPLNFVDSIQGMTPAQRDLVRFFLASPGTVSANGNGAPHPEPANA